MKIFSHTHFVCIKIAGKTFSSDLRKPCLKTGESLAPPTKLILFKRKSLTTLLKQDEKSIFTSSIYVLNYLLLLVLTYKLLFFLLSSYVLNKDKFQLKIKSNLSS